MSVRHREAFMQCRQNQEQGQGRGGARDNEQLLATLAVIDVEGWDAPTARSLLRFVREHLVRPLVGGLGLVGAAASQAEATGWEAAWEVLAQPSLRTAASPWGVVWAAVRRAAFGEVLAARYGVSERRGWELRARNGAPAVCRWEDVAETSLRPPGEDPNDPARSGTALVAAVVDALAEAGWARQTAVELIGRIIDAAPPGQASSAQKVGWRPVAADLALPPWQVRRVMVALLGAPGWPGLAERLLTGQHAADEVTMRAALRATRVKSRRSPALEALRAAA